MPFPSATTRILGHALLRHSAEEPDILAMPASPDTITTIEELLALPDDGLRHELLDGVHVVTPSPRPVHEVACVELIRLFAQALAGRSEFAVFAGKGDIVLGPRTMVQPDVYIVRKPPGRPLASWAEAGVPVLVVEVLSARTAKYDRGEKRRIYQQSGVQQYWIVDLDARIVERWTPRDLRPEILDRVLSWTLPGGVPTELDLTLFFRTVLES